MRRSNDRAETVAYNTKLQEDQKYMMWMLKAIENDKDFRAKVLEMITAINDHEAELEKDN